MRNTAPCGLHWVDTGKAERRRVGAPLLKVLCMKAYLGVSQHEDETVKIFIEAERQPKERKRCEQKKTRGTKLPTSQRSAVRAREDYYEGVARVEKAEVKVAKATESGSDLSLRGVRTCPPPSINCATVANPHCLNILRPAHLRASCFF